MAEYPERRFERVMDRLRTSKFPSSPPTPAARPWDRGDILRRLATFKSMTWFGKPQVAGPVACARRGWVNVDVDLLACEICGAYITFVLPPTWSQSQVDIAAETFGEQLDTGHKPLCAWRGNVCSEALARFPPTPLSALVGGFNERCVGLLQLSALPVISGSAIDAFKLVRGPQTESLLAQPPPLMPESPFVRELITGSKSGEKSENGRSHNGYYQAQRLIALCGWEPRSLPYGVDYWKCSSSSSKTCQPEDPLAVMDARKFPDPGPCVVLVSKSGDGGEKFDVGNNQEMKSDPASAVLDCSFCRASVGLWGFPTINRPLASTCMRLADLPDPLGSSAQVQQGGPLAARGVNGYSRQGGSGSYEVGHCEGVGNCTAIPAHVRSSVPGMSNLRLTIAGGPPPTQLISRALGLAAFGPIPGFGPVYRQLDSRMVGDFEASLESHDCKDHNPYIPLDSTTTHGSGTSIRACSAVRTILDGNVPQATSNKSEGSLEWTCRADDSAVDQLSQGAGLTAGNTNEYREADPRAQVSRCKRRKSAGGSVEAAGMLPQSSTFGLHALPCSSSLNPVDMWYLRKHENAMKSCKNESQGSRIHDIAVTTDNGSIIDNVDGTRTAAETGLSEIIVVTNNGSIQQVEPGLLKSNVVKCDAVVTNVATRSIGTGVDGGPSVRMEAGTVGIWAGLQADTHLEIDGTDFSVHQVDKPVTAPVAIQDQGIVGDFVPDTGFFRTSIPQEEETVDPIDDHGDTDEVVQARHQNQQHVRLNSTVEGKFGENRRKRPYYDLDNRTQNQAQGDLEAFQNWDLQTVEFDPLRQHRYFCPWVNGCIAAATNGSNLAMCGWQLTIDALHAQSQNDG